LAQLVVRLGLKTGLDIGCSSSSPLTPLRAHGFHSIGIDASPERLEVARRIGQHDEYHCADLRTFAFQSIPRIDVVVMSHVIEHLSREDGLNLLQIAERQASRLVYVETPRGFREYTDPAVDLLQQHRSGWFAWDFEGRGYTVFGGGLSCLRARDGLSKVLPQAVTLSVERLFQFWVFRRPQWSNVIAAIRHTDEQGIIRSV
jgi:hypothetical protein